MSETSNVVCSTEPQGAAEEGGAGGAGGAGAEWLQLERELRLKCHHAVYAALEKHVRQDQHTQMKALAVRTHTHTHTLFAEGRARGTYTH